MTINSSSHSSIQNIPAEIANLESELQNLRIELLEQQQSIQIGDTVQIINTYRNQQGIRGQVVQITRRQVVLIDNSGVTYRRAKRNVRLVSSSTASHLSQ